MGTPRDASEHPEEIEHLRRRLARAESRATNLQRAVVSNRRIGMAVGILMARNRLSEQQAFGMLRQASNRRNLKLRDVAERVIYTGTV